MREPDQQIHTLQALLLRFDGFEHHGRHSADQLHWRGFTKKLAFLVPTRSFEEKSFHINTIHLRLTKGTKIAYVIWYVGPTKNLFSKFSLMPEKNGSFFFRDWQIRAKLGQVSKMWYLLCWKYKVRQSMGRWLVFPFPLHPWTSPFYLWTLFHFHEMTHPFSLWLTLRWWSSRVIMVNSHVKTSTEMLVLRAVVWSTELKQLRREE